MKIGDKLPKLNVTLQTGETMDLQDLKGKYAVIYFYPKDSTPGCTTEGLDFNALLPTFKRNGAAIYGVSRDSVKSHQNFCTKQGFRFDLISDADEAMCKAFDVIHEKNMYGKKVLGVVRSTFLFNPDGKLVQEWRGVKVAGHANEVLEELRKNKSKIKNQKGS